MKLRMRFSPTGSLGAIFFIGSVAISGYSYVATMERLTRGQSPVGIQGEPYLYVLLSTIAALGIAMMIGGREIVSDGDLIVEDSGPDGIPTRSDQ